MPKKIADIEYIIFKAAWKLFIEKGYEEVDMKAIAKESGIAVGTLYNYYKNKRDLFTRVLLESWESTFSKLEEVFVEDKNNKLDEIIKILYYDIKNRKGIGANLFSKSVSVLVEDSIELGILNNTYNYVNKSIENNENVTIEKVQRLVHIILNNIVLLVNLYGSEDEENIKFILSIPSIILK